MSDEQLSPIQKYTLVSITALGVILCCVGLPIITLVPSMKKFIGWLPFIAAMLGSTPIHVSNWAKYRRAWRSQPLRWWKITFWIGAALTPICLVAIMILIPFAQKGSDIAILLIIIVFACCIAGGFLLAAGYINLLMVMTHQMRLARVAKSAQQDTTSDAPQ